MLFTTPLFLYAFFPLFFAGYFLTPDRLRNAFALAGSLAFYAWGAPLFVLAVGASAAVDFILGEGIARRRLENPLRARLLLALGVALNLGLLSYFKYADFFLGTVHSLLRPFGAGGFRPLDILLPLGISFITFEKITYLADLYRGTGKPAKNFLYYATYVFLFPKLLAGPILQYHDIAPQLEDRRPSAADLAWGLKRFILGLAKKVLIADMMAPLADKTFGTPLPQLETATAWFGILAFTLQIYFDFSGYSDMAIGMGRMMGFRLMENFNDPYLAVSFTDFWRRWHISLSSWIKNYLYIPLGGNRASVRRTYFNLALCFFLSGLWHGAAWTFVAWGLYHGFFLVLDRVFWLRASARLPRFLNNAITFLLVLMGWVLFRARSFTEAAGYYGRLLGLTGPSQIGSARVFVPAHVDLFLFALGFLLVFAKARGRPRGPAFPGAALPTLALGRPEAAGLLVLLLAVMVRLSSSSFNPFIYFRF